MSTDLVKATPHDLIGEHPEEEALIPIIVNIRTQEGTETLILDAQECSRMLSIGIRKYMGDGGGEANPEAKALARMMKVAVKGILLSFGPAILTFFLGKHHPRPGKQDDIVVWYSDMFGKIGIAQMVKTITHLSGTRDGDVIRIAEMGTQPNPRFSAEEN